MKKLLLLGAAALLASSSAMAQDNWYLIGEYNSWNTGTALEFEGTGNDLSVTVPNFTPSFKIISERGWNGTEYGAPKKSIAIELNTPSQLTSDDAHNIVWPLGVTSITNAIVKWNPSTATIEVVAEENNLTYGYPELYVTGSFCSWNGPGEGNSVKMTETDGIFTAEVNFTSENVDFKIANSGWHYEISGGAVVTDESASILTYNSVDNLSTPLTGNLTLTFNAKTMLATFGDSDLTLTEPDPIWAIVGSFTNNWSLDDAIELTQGDNGIWSTTLESLLPGFKIVDTVIGWASQLGTSTLIEANETYTLVGKDGEVDAPNIIFPLTLQEIKNATVQFDPENSELTIVAATTDIVEGYPVLYATGTFTNWANPPKEGSILGEEVNGVYTFVVDLGEGGGEFKVASADWGVEIAGPEKGIMVGNDPIAVQLGGENLTYELEGEQTLVFLADDMTMYFAEDEDDIPTTPPTGGDDGDDDDDDDEGDGPTVAISSIDADNAQAVYYNLQGVRVNNPENGVFIMKKGDKTYKVVIR